MRDHLISSGTGYESSLQLAVHGAYAYIAADSPNQIAEANERLQASSSNLFDLDALNIDLQSLQSVADAAKPFPKPNSCLGVLIDNTETLIQMISASRNALSGLLRANHT